VSASVDYLNAAMRHAEYEHLEDGSWYAHIPGLPGLWASAANVEDTRNQLHSALDEWLLVNVSGAQITPPDFDGISLTARSRTIES
jgi:predicted RNase H-like HicB family nuclease